MYVTSISEQTCLSRDEIYEKIEKKREELDNLVTDIGASHVVAKDLGLPPLPSDVKVKHIKKT